MKKELFFFKLASLSLLSFISVGELFAIFYTSLKRRHLERNGYLRRMVKTESNAKAEEYIDTNVRMLVYESTREKKTKEMHASQIRITIFSPFNQTNWRSGETSMYLDKILQMLSMVFLFKTELKPSDTRIQSNKHYTHTQPLYLFVLFAKQAMYTFNCSFYVSVECIYRKTNILFAFTVTFFFLIYRIFLFF